MCTVTKCGCSGSDSSGVLAAIAAAVVGFVVGLYWLARYVVGPALIVASVLTWRWLSGAPMTGRRTTDATFRRGAVPPVLPPRRFGVRIHWSYWPGYQRAIVRCVLTALVIAGWLYPVATAATVTATAAAVTVVRYRAAIRHRLTRRRRGVIRVRATVLTRTGQPVAALTATVDAPTWSSVDEQAASR